ncbi:MAG: hypothetical protein KDE35_08995 [Geminicoccaceae bacterium]|nr:hypothetical protein [Geminicoccaceae bacterium]
MTARSTSSRTRFIAALLAVSGWSTVHGCVAQAGFRAGDRSLQLDASYVRPQQPTADSITRVAMLGYHATTSVELGLQQAINYTGMADAEQIWDRREMWRARTAASFTLDMGRKSATFVPFVGLFAGLDYDAEDAKAFLGPHAGFRQFVSDDTYVRLRYRYEWSVEQLEDRRPMRGADEGEHVVSIGFGVRF